MRKNTTSIYDSCKNGKVKKGKSISTDGNYIFSYATKIISHDEGVITLNTRKYSNTTSRQQSNLRELLKFDNIRFVEQH